MNVLTVFAHPNPRSFCHAVLDRFDAGLTDAGHTNEIVDLYAIGFDPILRPRDTPSWLTKTIPDDMLDRMRFRENLLNDAGGPLKRFGLKRLIGDRDARASSGCCASQSQDIAPSSPELQTIEAELARRHWDAWLDTRVPALGDRTPRQAATSASGRERRQPTPTKESTRNGRPTSATARRVRIT